MKAFKEVLKTSGVKKTIRDYRIVCKYAISVVKGNEKLIKTVENASENILCNVKMKNDILHCTYF